MTKRIISIVSVLLICMTFSVSTFAETGAFLLYDGAALLTDSEANILLEKLENVSEIYQVDIIIATVESTGGYPADIYVEDFYDENGLGYGASHDGVLLLLAMEEREYRILSNGLGAAAISTEDIDSIGDLIVSSLSDGDYYFAFDTFIDECEYQINGEINGFPFEFGTNLLISLAVGLIVAFIVTQSMKSKLKSVRNQAAASQYTKQGSMQVTMANDFFLYRTVNRVRKANQSSSSSRSSGSSRNVGGGRFQPNAYSINFVKLYIELKTIGSADGL